jgi:tRNA(fMet)-specific endonuclease VapC
VGKLLIRGERLAHAYATGATIVTANTDEFKRIRGLKVENWLA